MHAKCFKILEKKEGTKILTKISNRFEHPILNYKNILKKH